MKRGFIFMVVCFLGCNKHSGDIIPSNQMAKVMWGVIQADEYVTGYVSRDSTKNVKLERMKLYQKVFSLHHVSEQAYFSSFKYYAQNPALYKNLIDSLSARASREQRIYQPPAAVKPVHK